MLSAHHSLTSSAPVLESTRCTMLSIGRVSCVLAVVCSLFSLLSLVQPATALRLPSILSSHMVVQRDIETVVWGTATANTTITLTIDGDATQTYETTANHAGNFSLTLPAQPSTGATPHQFDLLGSDGSSVSLKDVLYGDVYVCGGQSNMEFVLQDAFNATAEIESSAHYPLLRLFTVADDASPVYLNDTHSRYPHNESWVVSAPQYVNGTEWLYFSALCFMYGRNLQRELGDSVPIGLVESCYGGTTVEAWSDVDAINKCGVPNTTDTDNAQSQTRMRLRDAAAVPRLKSVHEPYVLWNAMIQPIVNYKLKGVLWYQVTKTHTQTHISTSHRKQAELDN